LILVAIIPVDRCAENTFPSSGKRVKVLRGIMTRRAMSLWMHDKLLTGEAE
jgi:hypothetical protein